MPGREVDGRDFLVWQKGNATPDPDDNVGDGTSATVLLSERYDQTLGDPITFTYTVTNSATTDVNPASFDCVELTQWASHQASIDTEIGGFIDGSTDLFPTETVRPTESLFDL